METTPGKAFLTYNEREDSIEQIAGALETAKVPFYFWRRDVKYGTSIDEKENDEFENALVFLIFLGRYGWGPRHLELAQRAIRANRIIIPVLIGDPPDQSEMDIDSGVQNLFKETRYFDLRKLDKANLARFVKVVHEELGVLQPQTINAGEYDHLVQVLYRGTERQRNFFLDKIRNAIWIDKPLLSQKIREELQKPVPAYDSTSDRKHYQDLIWLWRALVYVDAEATENRSIIQQVMQQPSEVDTCFWTLASLYEVKASYLASIVDGLLKEPVLSEPQFLALAIKNPTDPETMMRFRTSLHSNTQDSWMPMQALAVAFIPELVPDLCENLDRPDWASADQALKALSHPAAAPLAAQLLTRNDRVESTLDKIINSTTDKVVKEPFFDLTRYYAALLDAFDPQTVRDKLDAALNDETTKAAAKLLIDDWQDYHRKRKAHSTAGYYSDMIEGVDDLLGIQEDVQTLTAVMLAKNVSPPLAIGLFGDWGSGKSFFMQSMRQNVAQLADDNKNLPDPPFCTSVVSIEFNAWHYVDTNLWASLVSRIFDELSRHVSPPQTPEEKEAEMLKDLETAKKEVDVLEVKKKKTEDDLNDQTTKLQELKRKRELRPVSLEEFDELDIYKMLPDTEKKKLRDALTQMGIPSAMNSLAGLKQVIADTYTTKGRMTSLFLSVVNSKNKKLLWIFLAVVFVLIPIAFWLVQKYVDVDSIIVGATTVISEGIAIVTGIVVMLRKGLTYVNNGLQTVEDSKRTIEQRIAQKRATPTEEETNTEKKIKELEDKHREVTKNLATAKVQMDQLEAKVRKSAEEESLASFLTARTKSDDYRKYFGLISTIRQDFDDLEGRLRWLQKQTDPKLKKVERIVLYIDDLDRCPRQKVMDVLQAIHLILAYRLFVVVVGVDPRWLVHSLSETFTAFQSEGSRFTVDPELWQATPQNYLEKIFQVPFSIRPMTDTGYANLIKSLFVPPVQKDTEEERMDKGQAGKSKQELSTPPAGVKAGVPTDQVQAQEPVSPTADDLDRNLIDGTKTPAPPAVIKPLTRYVYEESLQIKGWETTFAEKLYLLMPTPRAAKRFTNTYRILKAPLKPTQLIVFEGTEEYPGDFQVPMLLLALLIGASGEAALLFPKLQEHVLDGGSPIDPLLRVSQLGLNSEPFERLQEKVAPIITAQTFPTSAKVFAYWIPRVSRFSFDLGRMIQPVNIKSFPEQTGHAAVNKSGFLINA